VYKILANLPFKTNYVHYLPSCHSTNEVAQDLLQASVLEGTIVITDNQFSGKGQTGNAWESEPDMNLTFSLILRPQFLKPNQQFLITIAISLGIKDALEEVLPGEVKIKWPNDIYFNDKKIAGLLIENVLRGGSFDSCIVGIGVNVNQTHFADEILATSMKAVAKREFALNDQLNAIMTNISSYYFQLADNNVEYLTDQYHRALLGLSEKRNFRTSDGKFAGVIKGTDEFGRLIIERDHELLVFQHKEVKMLF